MFLSVIGRNLLRSCVPFCDWSNFISVIYFFFSQFSFDYSMLVGQIEI